MGILEGLLYGLAGGAAAEFLGLWKLRRQAISELPDWLKSPFYWLVTGTMVGIGGGLVVIYLSSNVSLTPILAVNLGASAPLIIGSLAGQAPTVGIDKID